MTITVDSYISSVIDHLPRATPLRSQIAAELRGHIAERLERGQSIEEVVHQLGDPNVLAESYLSAVPLVSAPHGRRAVAKMLDILAIASIMGVIALIVGLMTQMGLYNWPFLVGFAGIGVAVLVPIYTVVSEYELGYTIGKRATGLRVVRESGTRIGLMQSIVRQLPVLGQIYLIDVLFALFTEKRQRAFELASKTRVVLAAG